MNKLLILIKKEFTYIFRDTKSLVSATLISIFLLPAIMFLVETVQEIQEDSLESREIILGVDDLEKGEEVINFLETNENLNLTFVASTDFISDFSENKIDGYLSFTNSNEKLQIKYVFDQNSNVSTGAFGQVQNLIIQFIDISKQNYLLEQGINLDEYASTEFSFATLQSEIGEAEQSGFILFILPYFILIALVQGAMQFAIEQTTGEKERNTLATTLSLNIQTWKIAMAKIFVTLTMSLYTMILNLGSIVLSVWLFPNAFSNGSGSESFVSSPLMFLNLFLVLVPLGFLASSIMILIGLYSRNQKEAGIYASPILMISIIIGLSAQAFDSSTSILVFAIPFVGHMAAVKLILLSSLSALQLIVVGISTLIVLSVVIFAIVQMFRKEEILFRT